MKLMHVLLRSVFFIGVLVSCSSANKYPFLKSDPKVLVRQWTRPIPFEHIPGNKSFEYSNVVIEDNTLIYGSKNYGITALYPSLQQTKWSLKIENGVLSGILVAQQKVFFGGGDGYLYALDFTTGNVLWKYNLRTTLISQPTYSNGRLFVTTQNDVVYAFDAGSGEWLWNYRGQNTSGVSILGASKPLVFGNDILVGLSSGYLVSLSVGEGRLKWQKKLHEGSKFSDVDAYPVLHQNKIYLPSYDGALYSLNPQNGDIYWKFDAGGVQKISIDQSKVYLPSSDGSIYAVDIFSGKKIWSFALEQGTPTEVLISDEALIVGSSNQYLYALDRQTGTPIYRFDVGYGSGFSAGPAYDSKTRMAYFLSMSGNLYSFLVRRKPSKFLPARTDGYATAY